jgi:hypothetical protein
LRQAGKFCQSRIETGSSPTRGDRLRLKSDPQWHPKLSLCLIGGTRVPLRLLLVELILPRLVHQICERSKVHPARLNSALRALSAEQVRGVRGR